MLERINLVPQKELKKNNWLYIYSVMAVFLISAGFFLTVSYQEAVAKLEAMELSIKTAQKNQEQTEQLQTRLSALKNSVAQKKNIMNKLTVGIAKLQKVQSEKLSYSKVLYSIESEMPESVKCNTVVIENTAGIINGIAKFYSELPEFAERLRNNEMFEEVSLQAIGRNQQQEAFAPYTFKIVFNLRQRST